MVEQALVEEVHRAAYVADAHADSLLWNRDLTLRSSEGQVDFPRLREGGVKLQCFTLVTRGFPVVGGIKAFTALHGWPAHARASESTRASWQIDQLERYCAGSIGSASIARSAADLSDNERAGRLSAVLGVEGAHVLEGDLRRLEQLRARGVRFVSLTHLMHNEAGGSSFPLASKRGLTGWGRELLAEMARLDIALDLAHASPKLVEDSLSVNLPIFCSHTGLASATKSWRNMADEHVKAIAQRGGVVCVIFATNYLGGRRLENVVKHILRALEVAGEDAVGLGSDFDGMVGMPRNLRDASDYPLVTRALLEQGLDRRVVAKVLGGNLRRFLEAGPLRAADVVQNPA